MTQQAEILRGSIPAKKGQSTAHWRIIGLGAGFAALVLVALVILLTPAVPPAVQPQGAGSEFAMNPELMVARRSAELMVGRADTTFLAANPELMVARNYRGAELSAADYLAANPELVAARGYSAPAAWGRGASLLDANPELMVARRYPAPAEVGSSLLAANPELMVARSYAGPATAESSFLAANPEVMIARRYGSR